MDGGVWTTNSTKLHEVHEMQLTRITKSTKEREGRETQSARQTLSPMFAAFCGLRGPDCHTHKEAGNFTLPAPAVASIFP
jgi:hypothetical protein